MASRRREHPQLPTESIHMSADTSTDGDPTAHWSAETKAA
jgi:hypothetical protein